MSIPINISVFIYMGILLLGTFTCAIHIVKAFIEKLAIYKISCMFISTFLLYSCFEFLLAFFGNNSETYGLFKICIVLSDIAYFLVVLSWLFLIGTLSCNSHLVRKRLYITVTAVYGIVIETVVYMESHYSNLLFIPNIFDLRTINSIHTLINLAFTVFLIVEGTRYLLYGIFKMREEKSQKLMIALSFSYILYLFWIAYWDYSVTVLSEKNLLKFDPILIPFFIVCLISLRMLYKNNSFLVNFSGRCTPDIIAGEDRLWEKLAKIYQLTHREIEIIQLLYKGQSNPDIGKALFIAEDTVKKHLNHIFRKTGTKNRYELISCITEKKDH